MGFTQSPYGKFITVSWCIFSVSCCFPYQGPGLHHTGAGDGGGGQLAQICGGGEKY